MASLHTRPRSPFYYAAFTGPDGRRKLVSTGKIKKDEAWEVALKLQSAAKAARQGTFTETQARKILNECLQISTGETLTVYKCDEWFSEWLKNKGGSTSPSTLVRYRGEGQSFLDSLGKRAKLTLAAIRPEDVRNWRDQRAGKGHSATTCNLALKLIRGAFERALKCGYISVNPCAAIDSLKDETNATRDVFSPDQVSKLVKSAEGDWQGVVLIGYLQCRPEYPVARRCRSLAPSPTRNPVRKDTAKPPHSGFRGTITYC